MVNENESWLNTFDQKVKIYNLSRGKIVEITIAWALSMLFSSPEINRSMLEKSDLSEIEVFLKNIPVGDLHLALGNLCGYFPWWAFIKMWLHKYNEKVLAMHNSVLKEIDSYPWFLDELLNSWNKWTTIYQKYPHRFIEIYIALRKEHTHSDITT